MAEQEVIYSPDLIPKTYTDPNTQPAAGWIWNAERQQWLSPEMTGIQTAVVSDPPQYHPIQNLPLGNRKWRIVRVSPTGEIFPLTTTTQPATTQPAPTGTTTNPTTGAAATTENLIFGFPAMYVYIGGASIAALIAWYFLSGSGKQK